MSHQGYEGWFPECIACRMRNVGAVVCLDPTCHEAQGINPIELKPTKYVDGNLTIDTKLVEENKHWWKCCQLCDRRIHADGGAFGSYAICVECFNSYVNRGEQPPTTPWETK